MVGNETDMDTIAVKTEVTQINHFAVLKELQKIFSLNFPDLSEVDVDVVEEEEVLMANKLFQAYSDILGEFGHTTDAELNISEMIQGYGPEPVDHFYENNGTSKVDIAEMVKGPESICSEDDSDSDDPEMEEIIKEAKQLDEPKKSFSNASVSMARKKEIVQLWKDHPKWKLNTLRRSGGAFELKSMSTLYTWKKQVERGPTAHEIYKAVDSYVFSKFVEATSVGEIVQATHLKQWALCKFSELQRPRPGIKFSAGKTWRQHFKSKHNLVFVGNNLGYSIPKVESETNIS